jgi:hypothetical protein
MPANTLKVDRTTPYGNPFIAGIHGTRAQCAIKYRRLLHGHADLSTDMACVRAQYRLLEALQRSHSSLRGKNLACWCAPGSPCHAEELLKHVNQ